MFSIKKLIGTISCIAGMLFLVMKGEIISVALTLLGVCAIVLGIKDLAEHRMAGGLMKVISGATITLLGWVFVHIALTIISLVLIAYGVFQLTSNLRLDGYELSGRQMMHTYGKPICGIVAGICLLLNRGGTVDSVFVLVGIVFLINGIMWLSEK